MASSKADERFVDTSSDDEKPGPTNQRPPTEDSRDIDVKLPGDFDWKIKVDARMLKDVSQITNDAEIVGVTSSK